MLVGIRRGENMVLYLNQKQIILSFFDERSEGVSVEWIIDSLIELYPE